MLPPNGYVSTAHADPGRYQHDVDSPLSPGANRAPAAEQSHHPAGWAKKNVPLQSKWARTVCSSSRVARQVPSQRAFRNHGTYRYQNVSNGRDAKTRTSVQIANSRTAISKWTAQSSLDRNEPAALAAIRASKHRKDQALNYVVPSHGGFRETSIRGYATLSGRLYMTAINSGGCIL